MKLNSFTIVLFFAILPTLLHGQQITEVDNPNPQDPVISKAHPPIPKSVQPIEVIGNRFVQRGDHGELFVLGVTTYCGDINEWHVDLRKSFCHFKFDHGSRFSNVAVFLGSKF